MTAGLFGQPIIESSGIGPQCRLFHEPVCIEVEREVIQASASALDPANTQPMDFAKPTTTPASRRRATYFAAMPVAAHYYNGYFAGYRSRKPADHPSQMQDARYAAGYRDGRADRRIV